MKFADPTGPSRVGKVRASGVEIAVHELYDLSRVLDLENGADAAGVVLPREQPGLQQRVVLRHDAVSGAEALRQRRGDAMIERRVVTVGVRGGQNLRHILGVTQRGLLEVGVAD